MADLRRTFRVAVVLAIALIAAACGAAPSTPSESPIASIAPSPSPSPQITTSTVFAQHAVEYMRATTSNKQQASDHLGSNELQLASMNTDSVALESRDFVEWLDAHPPMPCYAEAWGLYREGAQDFASGADLLTKWLQASPNGQHDDLTKAEALWTAGSSKIWDLTDGGFIALGRSGCPTPAP
jgi:hypothetical protein